MTTLSSSTSTLLVRLTCSGIRFSLSRRVHLWLDTASRDGEKAESSVVDGVAVCRPGATELDVDALCDKDGDVTICGIMEHIEEAGVHSGDSACSLPPQTIPEETLAEMRNWTTRIAKALKVVGLINVQYCIRGGDLYIIEANPRASRTVPFVAKAVGHPIAAYASLIMSGKTLKELNFTEEPKVLPLSLAVPASCVVLCCDGVAVM
ncbi:MAG: ATP-grasp domain-containing protein [Akkermansiaceae bacterium]|nr:ATP-grasp domain-containing protein [Akkermansiaceae bacterium]